MELDAILHQIDSGDMALPPCAVWRARTRVPDEAPRPFDWHKDADAITSMLFP
jgi:hypothetical protein